MPEMEGKEKEGDGTGELVCHCSRDSRIYDAG